MKFPKRKRGLWHRMGCDWMPKMDAVDETNCANFFVALLFSFATFTRS
jgi:hypothetical protein